MLNPRNRRSFPDNWDVHVAREEIRQTNEADTLEARFQDQIRQAQIRNGTLPKNRLMEELNRPKVSDKELRKLLDEEEAKIDRAFGKNSGREKINKAMPTSMKMIEAAKVSEILTAEEILALVESQVETQPAAPMTKEEFSEVVKKLESFEFLRVSDIRTSPCLRT